MSWSAQLPELQMRPFLLPILAGLVFAASVFAAPLKALSGCEGRDLIAALPAPERARLQALTDAQPHAQGNLWRATRGEEMIHLLGTYHLPDPRHDQILDQAAPFLDQAKVLLVEASPEEETRLKAEILNRPDFMFLTAGPTLPDLLEEADWQRLSAEMKTRGIPAFMAAKFRPWYMAVMLSMPPCAMAQMKAGARGLDHRLMARAEAQGVRVRALEPFDTLFSIFGDLTMEQELEMIRAAITMADRPEDMAVTLANAYFAGQSRLLWKFSLMQAQESASLAREEAQRQFDLMDDVMMATRNRRWILPLLEAAREGETFAAFGALHLSGKQGVLALLEAEGFTVTRLDG